METHINMRNRRNSLRSLCSSTTGSDVIQGIGSVMVLGGTTLMVTGAIFSGVAYSGTDETASASFRSVGPLLIGLSTAVVVAGYSMCHFKDLKQMWLFYKRRKQLMYLRKRDITDDADFRAMTFKGTLCAICFQCLVCVIIRRHTNSDTATLAENQDVELGPKHSLTSSTGEMQGREKFSSLSSLRKCKVSPEPVPQEPVFPEPVPQEPVFPEPVPPEPVFPEPVPKEPVFPEPVPPEPVSPEPAPPKPISPEFNKDTIT